MEVHSLGRYLLLSQEVTTWEFISRRSPHRRPIQQDVGINRCTGVPLHTHMLWPTSEKLNQFCRNDVDISDVAQQASTEVAIRTLVWLKACTSGRQYCIMTAVSKLHSRLLHGPGSSQKVGSSS